MVFSGIFGYYFGIAKFAKPILEADLFMGEKRWGVRVLSKILGTDEAAAFQQWTSLKGLLIAMLIHASFNFALEFNQFLPVIFIVGGGFLFLLYLLAHKAGDIMFSASGGNANMAKRDVDVVLELLGMWSREGRHKDVIDICQRLLMRDPNNKVVQLFQAKAMDKQKLDNLENSFTSLFKSQDAQMEDTSMRALVKQRVLMEMLKEKQAPATAQTSAPVNVATLPTTPTGAGPKIPSIPKITPNTVENK